jgi:hypothetical protein
MYLPYVLMFFLWRERADNSGLGSSYGSFFCSDIVYHSDSAKKSQEWACDIMLKPGLYEHRSTATETLPLTDDASIRFISNRGVDLERKGLHIDITNFGDTPLIVLLNTIKVQIPNWIAADGSLQLNERACDAIFVRHVWANIPDNPNVRADHVVAPTQPFRGEALTIESQTRADIIVEMAGVDFEPRLVLQVGAYREKVTPPSFISILLQLRDL